MQILNGNVMYSFVMPMKCAVCGVRFDANFINVNIRFMNPINSKRFLHYTKTIAATATATEKTHYHFALHFNVEVFFFFFVEEIN